MSLFNRYTAVNQEEWVGSLVSLGCCCLISLVVIGCGGGEPEAAEAERPVGPQLSSEIVPAMNVVGGAPVAAPPPNPLAPQTAQVAVGPQDKAASFDPAAVASKEEAEDWLTQLNFMVSEYNGTFDKMPPDLEEFIRRGYFKTLPPAPAGKKYYLDPESKQVVLKDK
jgi:hypothetical protein